MTKTAFLIGAILLLAAPVSCTTAGDAYRSPYAGQEQRDIKSLSAADVRALANGEGWGLAKAAELNGVPGPAHVLEMKNDIALSPAQVRAIEKLHAEMKRKAVPLGLELIELERALNRGFAAGGMTTERLAAALENIARVRKQLRYVHLAAHLQTSGILTAEQVARYNRLRGYSSDDPCRDTPEGHDPEMWKRHHGCP